MATTMKVIAYLVTVAMWMLWQLVMGDSGPRDSKGIRCYRCTGQPCRDPFCRGTKVEVAYCNNSAVCSKEKIITDAKVIRDCTSTNDTKSGCKNKKLDHVWRTVCHCNTDLCNDAERCQHDAAVLATLSAILLLHYSYIR